MDFDLGINPDLPDVMVLDEIRLRQVLLNLVGNAVKFTDAGYIKLSVYLRYPLEDDHSMLDLIFEVEDSGIGIAEDQQDAIFEGFGQQAGQSHAQYGGTGLGLTITKRLVEMMGGEISVTSEPGKGSMFRVIISDIEVAAGSDLETQKAIVVDEDTVVFEPARILIVDDVVVNRDVVMGYLESYDFTFLEAETARKRLTPCGCITLTWC